MGGGYISTGKDSTHNSVVMFSLPERVGALARALNVFEVGQHVIHLHPQTFSKRDPANYSEHLKGHTKDPQATFILKFKVAP